MEGKIGFEVEIVVIINMVVWCLVKKGIFVEMFIYFVIFFYKNVIYV